MSADLVGNAVGTVVDGMWRGRVAREDGAVGPQSNIQRALRDAQVDGDLLVTQIKGQRALLMLADDAAPDLLASGLLDTQYALLYRLIEEAWVRDAANENGNRGGAPRKAAEWELRQYCLGAVEALTKIAGGHGNKAKMERHVAKVLMAAGHEKVTAENFFRAARQKLKTFPGGARTYMPLTVKGTRDMLLRQHEAGRPIETYLFEGIAMRVRVMKLMGPMGQVIGQDR